MAFTVAPVTDGPYLKSWSIIATDDADTEATIAHGFVGASLGSLRLSIVGRQTRDATTKLPRWYASADAVNITVGKSTAAGTGVAGEQGRVFAMLPHSIAR